jgi:TolB-like protein
MRGSGLVRVSNLIAELKRRRVVRVAAVYGAVGFVVLQAADLMLPRLAVPDWALTLIVVLTILGFPIALVLAWALELTPEGVRVTAPPAHGPDGGAEPLPPLLGKRTTGVAAGLVLLGVGLGAGWFLKPATAVPEAAVAVRTPEDRKSIAVLPFDDLSPGRDQEWFSDGLTEEILNSLARLDEMQVTARNSSFQFKNRAVDVRAVGRQLGVANVLEGSVRRADDRLRITAQLIRVEDGFHLWSEAYDRQLEDVFAVQLDIAENIARVLDIYLDDARRERMWASGTRDPAAFLHYLRGRADYNRAHAIGVGESDLLWQANVWFERALEVDPGYALARFYHHDAFVHVLMRDLAAPPALRRPDGGPDLERIDGLMRADLDRAVRDAGEAPLGRRLALVRHYTRGDWDRLPRAVAALDDGAAAQSTDLVDGGWLWYPMMIVREEDRTRELAQWRLERDPLDITSWSDMVALEWLAGRLDEAQRLVDQTAELGLEHRYLDENRVLILLGAGRADHVLSHHLPHMESAGLGWWVAAMAHAELGNVAESRAALERGRAPGVSGSERICWVLARIGDQGEANACARAIDSEPQGWVRLSRMIVDHGSIPFDPEATPRFTAMYASTGARPWPRTQPVSMTGR